MKTLTLAVPTVGVTPRPGAALRWQPSTAPTGLYGLGAGVSGAAGVDCAAAVHGTSVAIAPVAAAAVDSAALPFVAPVFGAAATSPTTFVATDVAAVAGTQQVAVAPKQAKNLVPSTVATSNLVNFMRENASPRGVRAGAPPS